MLKHIPLAISIIAVAALALSNSPVSYAMDSEGCLTCHQYPGLVKFEKPDHVKVLHIDEEKYVASPHGKTDCKECHTKTQQVPHTGKTEVDCTTKCHLKDKEKVKAVDPAALSKYHEKEKFAITHLDDQSSCRVCHPLYPHSQNNKVRAFVNMHTGYTLCEVCHLKKEGLKNLTYDWKEPDPFEFTGEPYGTHKKLEITGPERANEDESLISKMLKIFSPDEKKPAAIKKTHYLISRIAVFSSASGEKKLLMNTADNEKAKEFLAKEKNLSAGDREKELKFFHRDIARKEISVACNDCHSPDGIMDFNKIGFNEKKTKDLQYLNIKSLITKYETFYLPNLFGH
ncbi:MAG: hypothetical protein HY808_15880 [Nitrospirae bacterium]|nr:hypothetical protein [Nitrospirota bacterium]